MSDQIEPMNYSPQDIPDEVTYGVPELIKNSLPALIEHQKQQVTAAQAKIEAIADLTHSAYQKAGSLSLTKEESDQLLADFPDEAFKPGAAGKENLIYIEHAFLRDRFIKVFGMGGWAIVPRSRWAEPFVTQKGVEGSRVYVEAMLVVRGCFVAEAIGEMEYYPKNASQNYGDAVEGATTAAFRRCAKNFGVGLQAWKKDWCQGWMDRKMHPGKRVSPPPPSASAPAKPAAQFPPATSETRDKFVAEIGEAWEKATQFAIELGWIMPNEALKDLPLRFVPVSRGQFMAFMGRLLEWTTTGKAVEPYPRNPEVAEKKEDKKVVKQEASRGTSDLTEEDDSWKTFPMPWGKQAGTKLEDLEKNYLYGLWANYTVETEYKGKAKKPETIAKDQEFRAMLDLAGAHYEFTKKD